MRYYQEEGRPLGLFFSEGMQKALERSLDEAKRFNHNIIYTGHLLLGLISAGPSDPAIQTLDNLGVSLSEIRNEVEFIMRSLQRARSGGEIGLGERAKLAVELANEESIRDGAAQIGTLHLLRGVVREEEGVAAVLLKNRGVTLDRLRPTR